MGEEQVIKSLLWICSSKKDLMDMPGDVIADFGHGLYQAQIGQHPDIAKPLLGFGGASVIELVQDYQNDAFRAVYTVRFPKAIVVLHAFQKKSKRGIETPKQDIDLIHSRLKLAEIYYTEWLLEGGKTNG